MLNLNLRSIRHLAPVLAVGVLGVAVSIVVWYLMAASERRSYEAEFAGRADNQATVLQNGIGAYWEKLYAVRALFESSNRPIMREEFESFARSLLPGHTAILNIAWIPRVMHGERAAHEMAAVLDGIPDYHIRAIAPDGSLPVSPEKDEYFPKFYSTEARTSPVYGLDNNDGGMRARVIARIRDENVLSTSPPLTLHIGQGDRRGFWAGLPVYARDLPHEMVEDRRRNLLGIVQGVFQIGVMFDAIGSSVRTPVRLYVFPPHAAVDERPAYFASRFSAEPIEPKSQAQLAAGLHRAYRLHFGDIQWTLVVAPESEMRTFARHQGSWIVLISGLLISGGLTSFVWAMRRSARKLAIANDKFQHTNLQFDAALNNMTQGLLMFDHAGRLVIFNRRFAELAKIPQRHWQMAALGKTVSQAFQLAHKLTNVTVLNQEKAIAEFQNILAERKTGTIVLDHSDGRKLSASITPMIDGGAVITFDDITERRRAEAKISHMAHYDALTDLPNRALFYKKMDELLTRGMQSGAFAILSLDLDHFKSVNDTLGHPVGDELLRAVAGRMRSCLRETDMVARLGGDEFAILQTAVDRPEDASSLAARVIAAVSAPYHLDGNLVVVGTSIGIAIAPRDGTESDQLMKNADLALYRCKADGGNKSQFFEAQMDASREARRALELDLRKALVNGEFTLDYQPIVSLKTGRITACEALIRWHQPVRGNVPPLEFIPIAEETGLIGPIGEWVLGQACADAVEWPDDITVAVNLSPVQFRESDFIGVVTGALEKSHLPAERLELEITELVLIQDSTAALAVLRRLKDLGASIAMDDFGTGHSSLGYLRSFPFDRIKIDQGFIQDLPKSKDSLAIIRAVVGLGRSLGIVTTAEGVETQGQLDVLKAEGCTEVQGFYFSPPKSAEQIKALLASLKGQSKAVA